MSAEFSPELTALLASGWCKSYPLLEVLPNGGASWLYLSSAPIVFGPDVYDAKLVEVGRLHYSLYRAADGIGMSAQNVDKQLGLTLLQTESALDRAPAVYYRLYRHIRDASVQFKVTKLSGQIMSAKAGEKLVTFKVVSDVYACGEVGAVYDYQGNCTLVYNDPVRRAGPDCAYTGALPTCDYTKDGANGCAAHVNLDGSPNTKHFGGWLVYQDPLDAERRDAETPSDPPRPGSPPDPDLIEGPGVYRITRARRSMDVL